MVKLYLFLLTASSVYFFACNSAPNTPTAKLKIDSLQYSAYRWRTNLQSNAWELFLAYYIKVDKDGSYLAMRHNTTPEPSMYFKGKIGSSVHRLLDSLAIVPLDTLYIRPELRVYDGNTFQLNFATNEKHKIDFYQIDAPPYLQRVAMALDTVIFKSSERAIQFDLSFEEQELKRQSLQRLGRLPKLEKSNFK